MRVKIVLRDRSTGLYYRGERDWVRNGFDALTFSNIIDAEAFCRARGFKDLQLIQQEGYFFRPPATRESSGHDALKINSASV